MNGKIALKKSGRLFSLEQHRVETMKTSMFIYVLANST
jgi:hypothetical protein